MAVRAVRRGTPYGTVTAVVGFLTENWSRHAGEYALYNNGADLRELPLARLYDIGHFLAWREYVERIETEEEHKAREKARRGFDAAMIAGVTDEDTGLPAWIAAAGIQPADGSLF